MAFSFHDLFAAAAAAVMVFVVAVKCRHRQEGNEIDKYDLNHPKLKRRPFMTLNIMLVGKFHNEIDGSFAANENFQKNDDQDDPNILPMQRMHEVCEYQKIPLLWRHWHVGTTSNIM